LDGQALGLVEVRRQPADAGNFGFADTEDRFSSHRFGRSNLARARSGLKVSTDNADPTVQDNEPSSVRPDHPCRCLCRGLEQITKIFPCRRTILQLSQIRLTLDRTFIELTAFVPDRATSEGPRLDLYNRGRVDVVPGPEMGWATSKVSPLSDNTAGHGFRWNTTRSGSQNFWPRTEKSSLTRSAWCITLRAEFRHL